MNLATDWAAFLFVGAAIVGALNVMIAYRLMEINWTLGLIGGMLTGLGSIGAAWTYGDPYWDPSLAAFKEGIILALAGAAIGITLIVAIFEPELGEESASSEQEVPDGIPGQRSEGPSGAQVGDWR